MNWKLHKNWREIIKKYQTVLLVLAAGICLMLLPTEQGGKEHQTADESQLEGAAFQLEEFESRVSKALSSIEGAGETKVIFTLKSSGRKVLAQDLEQSGEQAASTTVILGGPSSGQEGIVLQTISPAFQGALVICPGGNDPDVRLQLMTAVSALTGLGSDRISICKGI